MVQDSNFYEYICSDGLILIYSKNNYYLMIIPCVSEGKIQENMCGLERHFKRYNELLEWKKKFKSFS